LLQSHFEESVKWPEVTWFYPPEIKAAYYAGTLFREWFKKYPPLAPTHPKGHHLFRDRMLLGRDIPHSGPIKYCSYFHEFYLGTQYLDAGYDVLFYHRKVEDELCYRKACELFGDADGCTDAGQFIVPNKEDGGRAPDLIVFKPGTKLLRFVECKGKYEKFAKSQPKRFAGIEEYLNNCSALKTGPLFDPAYPELFPPLAVGQWIHVARLIPKPSAKG
jgi:hypothetical protein